MSKQILEKVVERIREVSNLNHWKNTTSVLQWFTEIEGRHRKKFISWDICDFYASITEKLLGEALDWAAGFVMITPKQRDIIFHVRKTFLFHKGEAWVKNQNPDFDIAMGSYDSAEVTDLVGLYMLQQIENKNLGIGPGGYRDDFAAYSDLTPKENNDVQRTLCELFDEHGLKISITANNARHLDFLDVTLDMMTGNYKPYHKPNASLLYVHAQSNHPKSIKDNIPLSVNRRLNILSSSEEMFDQVKGEYQEALKKAGYTHVLKYEKVNLKGLNKKKRKRQRYKHMFYFHPPHEDTVATKVGKRLLEILDRTIPPDHELYALLNRHTVKVGYSCMDNLKKKIQNHNIKVQKAAIGEEDYNGNDQAVIEEDWDPCNCQGGPQNCPLQGKCQLEGENVVYVCTVTRQDTFIQEKYCGSTQWFKTRWYQHNGNERHWKNRNKTSLAGYIWRLKTNDPPVPYTLEWKVIDKGKTFNPITGVCRLCLKEKFHILNNPEASTLNSREEVFTPCQHKLKFLLKNAHI